MSRVLELFAGHTELLHGFNTFVPPGYKFVLDNDKGVFSIGVGRYHKQTADTVQT